MPSPRSKLFLIAFLMAFILSAATSGCGRFIAHRIVQAPNTYPDWVKRKMPLEVAFASNPLAHFEPRTVEVGPPQAWLSYRIVEARDYQLTVTATQSKKGKETWHKFSFRSELPGATTAYTHRPRGTVVLLHGYSLSQRRMGPWALQLGQEGWQCVLVDLRGHGRSTGKQIHFGRVETRDLSQLLDELERRGSLVGPVSVLGESYGAAMALHWKAAEPRIHRAVAIAPYRELSSAILNMRRHYAALIPERWIKAGLSKLPEVLETDGFLLDASAALERAPVSALFVGGGLDNIAPSEEVRRLSELAASPSRLLILPDAPHEALPYYFDELIEPVVSWLDGEAASF